MQQRLRRDAAAVEADAAGVLLLVDERDLHAEVGGLEGGGVAAGAGAEDDDWAMAGIGVGSGDLSLQREGERVLERVARPSAGSGRVGAVDHAVVVGQRQRHQQARLELAAVPHRLDRRHARRRGWPLPAS